MRGADAHRMNTYSHQHFDKVAQNDLEVQNGDIMTLENGAMRMALPGEFVEGIAVTSDIFASDNETEEQRTVNYRPVFRQNTYKLEALAGQTFTLADVGFFFNIAIGSDGKQYADLGSKNNQTGQFRLEGIIDSLGLVVEVRFVPTTGYQPSTVSIPAGSVTFNNTASGSPSTTAQEALDELFACTDELKTDVSDLQTDVTALQDIAHVPAVINDSTSLQWITNGIDNQTFEGEVILSPLTTNIIQNNGAGLYVKDLQIETASQALLGYDPVLRELSIKKLLVADVVVDSTNAPDLATWIAGNYSGTEYQEGDTAILPGAGEAYIHNGGTAGDATDWTRIEAPIQASAIYAMFSGTAPINFNNTTGEIKLDHDNALQVVNGKLGVGGVQTYATEIQLNGFCRERRRGNGGNRAVNITEGGHISQTIISSGQQWLQDGFQTYYSNKLGVASDVLQNNLAEGGYQWRVNGTETSTGHCDPLAITKQGDYAMKLDKNGVLIVTQPQSGQIADASDFSTYGIQQMFETRTGATGVGHARRAIIDKGFLQVTHNSGGNSAGTPLIRMIGNRAWRFQQGEGTGANTELDFIAEGGQKRFNLRGCLESASSPQTYSRIFRIYATSNPNTIDNHIIRVADEHISGVSGQPRVGLRSDGVTPRNVLFQARAYPGQLGGSTANKSLFDIDTSLGLAIKTVSGSYTLDIHDHTLVADNATAPVTITIPGPTFSARKVITVIMKEAGGESVTIIGAIAHSDGTTGDLVLDGANRISVNLQADAVNNIWRTTACCGLGPPAEPPAPPTTFKLYGDGLRNHISSLSIIDDQAYIGASHGYTTSTAVDPVKLEYYTIDENLTITPQLLVDPAQNTHNGEARRIIKHSNGDFYVLYYYLYVYYRWDLSIVRYDSSRNEVGKLSFRGTVRGFNDFFMNLVELSNGDIVVNGSVSDLQGDTGYGAMLLRAPADLSSHQKIGRGGGNAGNGDGRLSTIADMFVDGDDVYSLHNSRYYPPLTTGVGIVAQTDTSGGGLSVTSRKKLYPSKRGYSAQMVRDGDFVYVCGYIRKGNWSGEANPFNNAYIIKYNWKTQAVIKAIEYSFDDASGHIGDVYLDGQNLILVGHTGNNTPNARFAVIAVADKDTLVISDIAGMRSTDGYSGFTKLFKKGVNIVAIGTSTSSSGNGNLDMLLTTRELPLLTTATSVPAGFEIISCSYVETDVTASVTVVDDTLPMRNPVLATSTLPDYPADTATSYNEIVFSF